MAVPHQAAGYGWAGAPPDPTAVMGRRIGAFFIDAAIAMALFVALALAFADTTDVAGALRDHDCHLARDVFGDSQLSCNGFYFESDGSVRVLDGPAGLGISAGVGALVYVLIPVLTGASLGKHVTGLRVVDRSGSPAGALRHVGRWIAFLVDGPFTLGICGLVTALVSKGHRRVGDMVAGTHVVRTASVSQPIATTGPPAYASVPGSAPPPGCGPPAYPPPPAAPPPPPG